MALNYQIALTNVTFEDNYNDVIRFNSREEQESYFKMDSLFKSTSEVNFNVDALIRTNIVYVDRTTDDLSKLMNYNYCIVKDNNIGHERKYFYYFVKQVRFNNSRQIYLDVELDVMNTYYLDLSIDDCLIERCHLNRFARLSTTPVGKVNFRYGKDSLFYAHEPLEVGAKYLSRRIKPYFKYNKSEDFSSGINAFINEEYPLWVYVFLAIKEDGYKVYTGDNVSIQYKENFKYRIYDGVGNNPEMAQPYIVACYPLGRSELQLERGIDLININAEGLNKFLADNGGFANVLSMKVSTLAPFQIDNYDSSQFNNGVIKLSEGASQFYNLFLYSNIDIDTGVMFVDTQDLGDLLVGQAIVGKDFEFKIEDIKKYRSVDFNPKLYSQQYYGLKLMNGVNNYDYDRSKINDDGFINIAYDEIISPDVTKQYLRIIPSDYSIYTKEVANNFTGLVSTIDFSLPYSKNNLDIFLANNKNFFMQRNVGYARQSFNILDNALTQLGKGNILGSASSLITGSASLGADAFNQGFEVDNMESSPEQLASANGNGAFNIAVDEAGIYLEIYEASMNNKKQLDDFNHLYGFTYNHIDNIDNVNNIRKNFNYVKAQVEIIKSNKSLSNEVRNKVRSIFNKGVTFWNVTDRIFEHNVLNYERWLDE